ncbi:HAD family hydrolase [Streptococcus danieliae]|uniref:HAD family hydrolase n=1 Tax=Streptococcus danieliae TaxID=747656 RepID=A0A7Z0M4Q1_9STRE|nr:HAD family hydrolase [Streptococcus danieliae]MBF0698566.1 HAD family hydrolase [Streptococcus danieliae]NYS95743.1 HAD family hydrolase [Streptococcus danieliae]
MFRLMATDLDGTFLDGNHQFDQERFASLLDRLDEQGIVFAAASGRGIASMRELFADFQDRMYLIGENGSIIEERGQVIWSRTMDAETVEQLFADLVASPYVDKNQLIFSAEHEVYALETVDADYLELAREYHPQIQLIGDLQEMQEPIFKVTLNLREAEVQEGVAWLVQHLPGYSVMTTGYQTLDIVPTGIDKGAALGRLLLMKDWHPDDLVAFGDQLNDRQMLELAGLAICPENAKDEIKAIADRVIGPASQGSVLKYMEELV